jgi:hypothetical protein
MNVRKVEREVMLGLPGACNCRTDLIAECGEVFHIGYMVDRTMRFGGG